MIYLFYNWSLELLAFSIRFPTTPILTPTPLLWQRECREHGAQAEVKGLLPQSKGGMAGAALEGPVADAEIHAALSTCHAVLGLGGPGVSAAGERPCTVGIC